MIEIQLMEFTQSPEKLIEKMGRICYQSNEKITNESSTSFIKMLLKNGHHSVLEHASASFIISGISRALTHQLVRHRIATYSQKSQRYVLENNFDYIIPTSIEINDSAKEVYIQIMKNIRAGYANLVNMGVNREDARYILPNACTTEIGLTMNYREFLHGLNLRVSQKAQWEIRDMFIGIWKILFAIAPKVFNLTYFEHWSKDYEYKKEIFLTKITQ